MANINDLSIGVSQILDDEFPNIKIHDEKIKQGFEELCFFIKVLNSGQNKEINKRYKKNVSFDIHYFSDKDDINSDCNDMADKLYEVLEYVTVSNSIYRASGMNHQVIDDVLHFMLKFDYHVIKESQAYPKMNALTKGVVTKNG